MTLSALNTPRADPTELQAGGQPVLRLAADWAVEPDATGAGIFLRPLLQQTAPWLELPLGQMPGLQRFTSLYRFSPFWTRPAVGNPCAMLMPETLWLLAELGPGRYAMLLPLLGDTTRHALRGRADHES